MSKPTTLYHPTLKGVVEVVETTERVKEHEEAGWLKNEPKYDADDTPAVEAQAGS